MAKAVAPPGHEYVKIPGSNPVKYKLVRKATPNDKGPARPADKRPQPKPAQKKKVVAPPGFQYVKDPKRPGKYKLVRKGSTTPGAATPGPATPPPKGFVETEIARQIGQDQSLTNYLDQQTASIADTMAQQSTTAANVASQYTPATAYNNPTLDANAQARVTADAALTNQVGQDQNASLAALIAQSGSAGTDLFANMRGASQVQHRDYARRLEGLRPELQRQYDLEQLAIKQQAAEEKRAQQQHALALKTQALQNQLAVKEFGLRTEAQGFAQTQASQAAAAADAGAATPAEKGRYGFGAHFDEPITAAIADWRLGITSYTDEKGNTIAQKYKQPWRDLHKLLRSFAGLNNDQAALLATKVRPESITGAKNGAKGVAQMLKNLKVSTKVQGFIIKKYFGDSAWKLLSANNGSGTPGRPASTGNYGTHRPPAQSSTSGPVSIGMLTSAIQNTPHKVKVGSTFRLKNKNFTVQKVQRTISGLTYSLRGPTGRPVTVTVPNRAG